jgi:hypothetical protein
MSLGEDEVIRVGDALKVLEEVGVFSAVERDKTYIGILVQGISIYLSEGFQTHGCSLSPGYGERTLHRSRESGRRHIYTVAVHHTTGSN